MTTDEPLLEWQLGEFSAAKPEKRSRQWSLGCAELARDLRKALQDHSRSLVKSFLRWSDSPLEAKSYAGIAFADCARPSHRPDLTCRSQVICHIPDDNGQAAGT